MLKVLSFTFNPYQENTYVVYDHTLDAIVIDPGCYTHTEQAHLRAAIDEHKLKPVRLINTHGHIDHMLGNDFVKMTWGVPFAAHKLAVQELTDALNFGPLFGLTPRPSPHPDEYLEEGDTITFGSSTCEVLYTPGHAAGHISLHFENTFQLFSGDVLFQKSIGRTDLPGGDYQTLMSTITEKILPLGDEITVYPGHGSLTTIGEERKQNVFIAEYLSKRS